MLIGLSAIAERNIRISGNNAERQTILFNHKTSATSSPLTLVITLLPSLDNQRQSPLAKPFYIPACRLGRLTQ